MLHGGLWKIEHMHRGNFVLKLAIYPCRSDLSFHGRVLPELSEDGFISSQVHHVLLGLFFFLAGSCRIMQNRSSFVWWWNWEVAFVFSRFPSIVFGSVFEDGSFMPRIHPYICSIPWDQRSDLLQLMRNVVQSYIPFFQDHTGCGNKRQTDSLELHDNFAFWQVSLFSLSLVQILWCLY